MPGPSNKKRKQKGKGEKRLEVVEVEGEEMRLNEGRTLASPIARTVEQAMFEPPFIHDPGNGPRVRDVKMFIKSTFAQPVAEEDALCRELGRKEVLERLKGKFPEDTALVVWYNKSRAKSRICPACLRLYNIGDELIDLTRGGITGEDLTGEKDKEVLARQQREQELSGFCSAVCFVIASVDFARAIKSAWGHTKEEMSIESWRVLESVVVDGDELRRALGMVVKMTRLHDLGLLQLCFE